MIAISTMQPHVKPYNTGADLGGGCRGCAPPPPRDDLRFSNTTGILQKNKNYVVYWCSRKSKRRVHPLLKKSWIRPSNISYVLYICTVSLWLRVDFVNGWRAAPLCIHHVPSIILIERGAYEKEASENLMRSVCFYALSNVFIAS